MQEPTLFAGAFQVASLPERIATKIVICGDTGCWEWRGSRSKQGYGRVNWGGHAVARLAHRVIYNLLAGPIPDGFHLDHLCRNTSCVNPAHLDPVSHGENLRRGVIASALKTHCPQGHPYDEENTYVLPSRPTARYCRACHRLRHTIAGGRKSRAKPKE